MYIDAWFSHTGEDLPGNFWYIVEDTRMTSLLDFVTVVIRVRTITHMIMKAEDLPWFDATFAYELKHFKIENAHSSSDFSG